MSSPDLDVVDQAAEPESDLWTSDSERGVGTTDPLPSGATDTPTPEAAPDSAVTAPDSADAAPASTERDDKGQFKSKSRKPRTDPQARVEQATGEAARAKEEARQAREEAARYKAELEAARRPAPAPASAPIPSPAAAAKPFPDFEAWSAETGNTDWNAYNRAVARDEAAQFYQEQRQQEQRQARVATYRQRMEEGITRYPELAQIVNTPARGPFDDALARHGLPQMPQVMVEAVVDSELAPEIVRFFGTHPEDAAQLAAEIKDLPVTAASVVRKLLEREVAPSAAARPESASPVRPSAAKPPVTRVGGTANAAPLDPEDLEFGPEYIRQENAREAKRREAGRW